MRVVPVVDNSFPAANATFDPSTPTPRIVASSLPPRLSLTHPTPLARPPRPSLAPPDLTPEERAQNDEVQLGAIPFTKTGERRRKDANVGAKGLGRRRTPRRKSGSLPSPAANEVWEASKRDGSGSNTPRSSRDVSYRDGASGSRPRSREGSLRGGSGILKN